ncbi:hypothetical protein GFC01_09635 [Desulfofundulus thermobenzoicus]|uniref:Uncharacterized protein n=1 Tax=Desulfofundulus thermobenzoicus TaxID=29376 RepID=A0A6N7IST1_9FIRM|nr:hypothetical protein [Desulfofundulus thermobenzoicus]MQL52517.1 hypothetical protein [Desulfofundulus thermobenzoicus]
MKKKWLVVVGGVIVILSFVLFGCAQRSANDRQVDYRVGTQGINDNQRNNDKSFKYSSRRETTREFQEVPIKEVLSRGKTIKFTLKAENKDWIRPTYSKAWDDPLFKERFPDPSVLVEAAMHRLFELPAGTSLSFPFYVSIGLDGAISEADLPADYIGFLIVNSRINGIMTLNKQVAITAEPARSGYQIIWINRTELPRDKMLVSLVTPDGYEVDYLPIILQ